LELPDVDEQPVAVSAREMLVAMANPTTLDLRIPQTIADDRVY
jgi:hypothetical protein